MQSWPDSGQNGADDQWQANFGFTGQNGQFDPHQNWSQSMGDPAAYSHINPQDASTFFDSPHQGNAFLTGSLHGSPSSQAAFHTGHETLGLNQQFSQASQDVIDPAFSDIHPDLFSQQGKLNLGDSMSHLGNIQGHAHPQSFSYSFSPDDQSFDAALQQYQQPHLIPPQNRQQSHTPVQQFEGLQQGFAPPHDFSRATQQSPVPAQPGYTQPSGFQPSGSGAPSQFQSNTQPPYQQQQHQQQQQQHVAQQQAQQSPRNQQSPQQPHQQPPSNTPQRQQQQAFSQPAFISPKPVPYQQNSQPIPAQSFLAFPVNSSTPPTSNAQYLAPTQTTEIESASLQPSGAAEPQAKKRKRAVKSAVDTPTPEPVAPVQESADAVAKKVEEVDALQPPTPTAEDAQLIAQFNKRTKAAQAKQPSIKGLPHLVYDPSTKIPAPKSYDKLAPLVAIPSRSGKPIVPEFGYSLPCEIQGRFTSQYRPSLDRGGLDERRMEAKAMLDEFDRHMKALGKRRPKYTEYPHAFKEQLKSDEASKNKAEKRAKKEQEEEKGKPVGLILDGPFASKSLTLQIRAAVRPSDPDEATVWDVLGIVHIEHGVTRTSALIATRVQQAGEFIIKLRAEMNRSKQELDQAVKDKQPEDKIAKIRQESDHKKHLLYRVLDATLEHADDAVLDNLGGHQKLVLSLVNALIMCIKSGDFSGKLPKIVLELFTHFPMTKKIAETTNFDTVRKRFADKGDDEVKGLVAEISANIKKALKAAEPETATGYTGTSAASRAKAAAKSAADHSTKRGRDDDTDVRSVKKIAVESTGSSLSKKLAHPKIQLQSASKTTAAKAAANSILPGKTRPVPKSIPKPDGTKTEKSVADEKNKIDPKNGHSKTETTKPLPRTETKVPLPKTAGLSGIASLLDAISAPKAEAPAAAVKDTKSPEGSETPEERAKRLRKEARRKLRVSWKPESELVQIKIFQKEENEDEGRDVNMLRDAGDDRSEGMVLKQRADVDEDDDDDDIPYQPWVSPTPCDLSNLAEDTRNKNFVTRGGNVTFTTDEQQRIAEREQRELMAIYTDPDDIPPTPKSPHPETVYDTDFKTNQLPADDPQFQELQLRWRDEQLTGIDGAMFAAIKRLDSKENPSNRLDSILGRLKGVSSSAAASSQPLPVAQHSSGQTFADVPLVLGSAVAEQVLALLRSDRAKNWIDPNPSQGDVWRAFHYSDPMVHLSGNAIEMVARSLAGKPYPAITPPEWILHDQEKVREWQLGYNKELAARQKKADEERALLEAQANALRAAAQANPGQASGNEQDWAAYYAQQQQYAPYLALLQQMNGGQQPQQPPPAAAPSQQAQIPDSQLQSILAAINQPAQQPQQNQAANPANFLNPNDNSYQQYMLLQQMAQGQQPPPPPPPPPPAAERDRDWDRGDEHPSRREERERDRDGKDGRRKRGTLPPHKPANKALIGTKPCTFWQQGKCARGDKCTFRHD